MWESDGIYGRILFYEDLGCFGEELGRLPIWGHIGFLCKSWLNAKSQVQFPFLAVDPTSVSIEFILPYWHFPEYNIISLLCFLLSTFICSLLQAPWLTQLVPFYLGRGRDEDITWRLFLHFQGVQQQTQIFSMGSDWFPAEWSCLALLPEMEVLVLIYEV